MSKSVFSDLRAKAERHVVYPLNRDECLALIAAGEALVAAVEDIREHAKERDRYIPMRGVIRACDEALRPTPPGKPARSAERSRLFWKQLEQASKNVAEWPDYLKRAFGVESK